MYFSLVCTKNLSETLPSCGWSTGPDNLHQKGLKLPTYDVTYKKTGVNCVFINQHLLFATYYDKPFLCSCDLCYSITFVIWTE